MMLTFVNVIWGARCGKTARRVLLGETRTRGHAYSVRRRRESACDRKAPHRLKSSRLVSTNLSDAQKFFVLQVRKGVIEDGPFARTRNPNYLGELLIYSGFVLASWHWSQG